MSLIAIDPGKGHYGLARFDHGELIWCERQDHFWAVGQLSAIQGDSFFIELPQVYAQRKWKGDPNDLISVAVMVGALRALAFRAGATTKLVKPHEWKGSVPKDIMQKRIVSRLNVEEQAVLASGTKGLNKRAWGDVVDAVGIGLWALDRL